MADELDVTVVVPVRNEEKNLPECLRRLKDFKHILVVDSNSQDATRSIAEEHGATVLNFAWDGRFPKKRNWALRNHRFESSWVFFLDADEYIDQSFVDELKRVLPSTPHVGFWITYQNWFLGRRLDHGEANRKLALFKVGAGEYEKIDEDIWSHLDMEVHEHPVLNGTTGDINARVDHHDYRGYDHWLKKHNDYSSWEAHRLQRLRAEGALDSDRLTDRQKTKYKNIGKWWLPAAYFLATYVGKSGYKDGYEGFVFAMSKGIYFWQVGVKTAELEMQNHSKNHEHLER